MNAIVIVAALGYFVDVYDLLLFSIVRRPSLISLGVPESELVSVGLYLLNLQMLGMLSGGIMFGIWGDKKGRVSVLFGSIVLYSLANIANGFVQTVDWYAALRFIAGVGLAGELGAGITLVSETMSKESRGYGTTLVGSVGVAGAIAAALVGDHFDWRTSYFIGGGLGLLLLGARFAVYESGLYSQIESKNVPKGDLRLLISDRNRFVRYLCCILAGLPIWFAIGILVTFSPEFGKAFGMQELPNAGRAIMFTYIGLVLGDLSSGLMSQLLKTRKKVICLFLIFCVVSFMTYLNSHEVSLGTLYATCAAIGFSVGYWVVLVTSAAEQFGTNLRATVTTTVPNFIRGSLVPIAFCFDRLKTYPSLGIVGAATWIGIGCVVIAFLALQRINESYGEELDFLEV